MGKLSIVWGMLATGVVTFGACSPAKSDAEQAAQIGAEIIGGTLATAYPEAAYLDIDMSASGGYACSAVLVAPRVVLTAGHCVDGHSKWDVHVGSQVRHSVSGATYDWKEAGSTTVNPLHHDLGVVFLDTGIPLATYPTLASAKEPDGTKVMDIGRVQNGTLTNQLYGAATTVSDGTSTGYPYDYVATDVIQAGDSGGPVFVYGTHRLVAINSGAGGGIEVLSRVDLLLSWLEDQIASHGGGGAPSVADAGGTSSVPDAGMSCAGPSEVEPNEGWKDATKLDGGALCGSLDGASDQDWFAVAFGPGPVTVELSGAGDATFGVGFSEGSTCTAVLSGLKQIALSSPRARKMCVVVSSATHASQLYGITRR